MSFHTEREAEQKWCPLTVRNGSAQATGAVHCITTNCMAWDWEDDADEYRAVDHSSENFTVPAIADFKPPEGDGWQPHGHVFQPAGHGRQWRMHFKRPFGARRRGFCGLARRADVQVVAQ